MPENLSINDHALTDAEPNITVRMDAAIDLAIREKRIVGAVVLIARNGRVFYRRTAGMNDRENGIPMTEDAVFRLASITKPIVTAALMKLVEDGRVSLDDPVTRFLPDFLPRTATGDTPAISLHQLLTHTSGLSYGFIEPAGSEYERLNISDGLDQPGLSLTENLDRLTQARLVYDPGNGWRYSLGMDVIGAVIEKMTELPLSQAVRQIILDPLGLTKTDFIAPAGVALVTPYRDGSPAPLRMTEQTDIFTGASFARFDLGRALNPRSYPSGGAGMIGTASEILRFLEVIRQGGGPILKPETVTTMMADQVGPQSQTQGPGWGFGYGWAVLVDPRAAHTPQSVGTVQWGGAYGHSWFIDPVQNLTVVALTNTAFEGMGGKFVFDIRDAVYAEN
ncbi:beta-lactamase family protein [Paracoccus sp. 11-3]|uniref:Beta-lactamase family protein n=1 Tax=Paracoccus amoyensis TaxID=2760093 RepID=A0A926J9R3_9RHOB|nr:serine hydrolase domain-containing protein [Paracoccus amoyensis]MBC9245276.1 beta-lactamase family protein [Paracoccus amoyensis]